MKRDIVFLHGGSHGSWCWAPLFEELRKTPDSHARLIALDEPGCGIKRGRDVSALSAADIVRELNDDLRALQVHGAVLVGHSLAGVIMPAMSLEDPSLFSELIHVATSSPASGESNLHSIGRSLRGENPEQVGFPVDPATTPKEKFFRAMFGQDLSDAQFAWLMREASQDATPLALLTEPISHAGYEGLGLKTTYVLTQRDVALPPIWQRRFAERLSATRIVEIDTPHEPFISHPRLLAETLLQILNG